MPPTTALAALVTAATFLAAGTSSAQPSMPATWKSVSATAQRQIHDVEQATAKLASTDSAQANGFGPVFGWIPTMGTHWVSGQRMLAGKVFALDAPSQLMFSRVNGKNTLVGAAYEIGRAHV